MGFKELKKNSAAQFEKLNAELTKINNGGGFAKDENVWTPTVDKAGNAFAIIRFLPAPENEDMPFVRLYAHGFKDVGGWYIENCSSTHGDFDSCPACTANSVLYKADTKESKELAGKRKRKLNFWSNILVVKDAGNPENEGKVFKFRYGKKIWDKLNDLMNPDPNEGKDPIDPFNMWTGADFNLRQRKVEGYPNYERSTFSDPSSISDDDDRLEEIYNQLHSLQKIIAKDQFKDPEVLKKRLNKVIGEEAPVSVRERIKEEREELPEIPFEVEEKKPEAKPKPAPKVESDEDDDDLAFFRGLASDD